MNKVNYIKRWLVALLVAVMAVAIGVGSWLLVKEHRLNDIQQSALEQLDELDGEYDTNKIVLNNTSYSKANALAAQFNAKLRITSDGKFATLTLPEGVMVRDVYMQRENRAYLPDLSLDIYSRVSEEESTERVPSSPNYTVTDPYSSVQSYINYLNIGDAWNNYKGNNVTVAVIDTGIDYNHTEFAGKISEYSYNATEDKIVKDYTLDDGGYDWSLIEDNQGHGTAVAGVIAASMDGAGTVGIAPDVTLLVIKAECDANGNFYNTSDLVFGLYYAVERDVDIVNMSFGGYTLDNPYAAATKLAVDSDIVCVAAAGNDGTTTLCYPAADANVIGVGALAQDSWELATYSNYGENVDMVAPGTVYTTKLGGEYGVMNGTSFASPIVAAAVALYRQQNRYCEFSNVQEMLYASCYDLGSLGNDWYFGYGALDINALICEERGTVTFNMLTDELENTTQIFIRNHTLQNLPEPERTYAVFDGWYYDIHCLEEVEWYADIWTSDLTLYANWVNEDDGVPYTYVTLDDNTIEIRSYTGKRRYITIPEMIEGKVVSSIGEFAFDGQTRLREVNLPSGLTNIGAYAFRNCNNLLSITIPEGVTTVGEYAFYNTVRLDSVGFEGNSKLQKIGQFAFAYSGLSRFELPANVKSIDGSAFFGASSLKSITVNKGNTSFQAENGVLFNNTGSTLVAYPAGLSGAYTIPDAVRTIGSYAFGYTKSAVALNAVTTISACAFEYASLSEIILPDCVTSLGKYAFACNFNLSEVTLGSGIKSIPDFAFNFCSALSEIEIPAQVVSIGSYAFADTYSLQAVTFARGSNLTSIGEAAFSVSALQSIAIPDSVLVIGGSAFAKCYMLSQVTISENSSLQVIGVRAFSQDISLNAIYMPANLMQIGGYAFMGTGLQTVTLPASLTYLGAGAFASCHSLTAIDVESGNAAYVSIDGAIYNADKTVIAAYPAGNAATTYTIERTVTEIGEAAFYGSWNLTGVTLPNGLITVSSYGFYDCENIRAYSLPETLTYIEAYAFSYNTSLNSLAIPDSVYQISNYAFACDYNLRSITFNETATLPRISYGAFAYTGLYSFRVPASVSTIAQGAFLGCEDLTQITFAANSKLQSISAYMFDGCTNLYSVTFENGSALTSIQAHGFEGATKLQTVNFGDAKLTNIDNYAFRFCESLTTLSVPDGVTYIGRFAFYGASSLTRLDLPESIDYIGRYAFYGASNLNIYFAAEILPNNLQENWDNGIAGYYVGVTGVVTDGDWQYAVLKSGGISIIKYTGSETELDLTALNLSGDILSIGGYAFYFSGITSITLPDTLTTISAYAFARSGLTSITIPASVEYIAQNAFFYTPLTSVTFAENSKLTKIEQYAFAYTRSLQSVTLPASLSEMGSYAFYQSGITVLNFEKGIALTEIPQYAFAATKITSVVLPDSVTLLNHNAFRDCTYLQTVTYGNNEETYLMSNVFYNTGLTTVVIPSNVTYIGEYALVGLESLTAFEVSAENPYYSSIDGLLYNKDGSKLIAVPAGRTGSIVLPESLEVLGYGAFENTSLEEISFNENSNILTFGYRAFYGAKNLTSITIPASVVSIDYYAFAMCEKLASVTFAAGSKLTGVYEGAFYGCRSLKDILLPDSIVEISDFAFYGCSSLTGLPISETSELKGIYQYTFAYTGITDLTLPETVIDIGEYAFRGAQLVSVTIPDTNAKQLIIGIGAFAECESLVEITLPFIGASYEDDEITWFGYIFGAGGFMANSTYVPESLKTVTITEGITYIGKFALYELSTIERMNIPNSVSMLYSYAFYGTTAKYELTNTIYLDSTYAESSYFGKGISGHLAFAEGITDIGDSAIS